MQDPPLMPEKPRLLEVVILGIVLHHVSLLHVVQVAECVSEEQVLTCGVDASDGQVAELHTEVHSIFLCIHHHDFSRIYKKPEPLFQSLHLVDLMLKL